MLIALDVHYLEPGARAAAVAFERWTAVQPILERTVTLPEVEPYVPGQFYRRELPCLRAVLAALPDTPPPSVLIVDGFVWLGEGTPGLGKHLFDALEGRFPVVGVAKTRFQGADALEVQRGDSQRPLWVGAVGLEPQVAAAGVRRMAGRFRLPDLLKRVDHLCRGI